MRSLFTRKVGLVLASSLLGVLLVDVLLQLYFTLHLDSPLLLLQLPQLWHDPWKHEQATRYLLSYAVGALVGGMLANAVVNDEEEAGAVLGHEVIEASLGDLKKQGLLEPQHEGRARRHFWWNFWDAAKRDKR